MQLTDVNVLVYAANEDYADHALYRDWLQEHLRAEAFAVSELVLSGVLRISTSKRLLPGAVSASDALLFVEAIRGAPGCVSLRPGPRHWEVFTELCRQTNPTFNEVPDAYHAALAIEHGCEWVTADRGFAKFPGLRWRHPLDA